MVDSARLPAVRSAEHRRFKRSGSKPPDMDADERRRNASETRSNRGVRA
jgi:hypothetical protein